MNVAPDIADHAARILIVDDEAHNRQLLQIMLAAEGFVVLTAASGEEALAIVAERPPDLVESERLYRSTFDAAPVGIVHVDLDGHCRRVNQHLCDFLGYAREELESAVVQKLMQSDEVAGQADAYCQMAAGTLDRHVVDERRYRRRDGTFVWARVNMSVHRDAASRAQHFISVIEDVTERRTL